MATHALYTLSLHDAFRSLRAQRLGAALELALAPATHVVGQALHQRHLHVQPQDALRERQIFAVDLILQRAGGSADRKSTRLNSSHLGISYAVFCLKNINT